jgi:uncharacterized membrane protein
MQWYFFIGMATGMRTMTGIAVVSWFAWLGLLPQEGWSLWLANPISVVVFTVFALGEYYADTLPGIPNRTDLPLLLARCLVGGFAGVMIARALTEPWAGGALFTLIGVFVGAFGGVRLRLRFANRIGRDRPVALIESLLALLLAILGAYMLHRGMIDTPIA